VDYTCFAKYLIFFYRIVKIKQEAIKQDALKNNSRLYFQLRPGGVIFKVEELDSLASKETLPWLRPTGEENLFMLSSLDSKTSSKL